MKSSELREAGALVVSSGYRPNGRPPGVRGKKRTKLSKKQLEVLRTSGYRRNVPGLLRRHARIAGERAERSLAAILDAAGGDFEALRRVNAEKLSRLSAIHDASLDEVEDGGVVVEEEVRSSDGAVLASRRRENPALGAALRLGEVLGVDAKSNLLTPASRAEGKRDESVSRYFDERSRLEAWKSSRALPAAAVTQESEPIEDAEEVEK